MFSDSQTIRLAPDLTESEFPPLGASSAGRGQYLLLHKRWLFNSIYMNTNRPGKPNTAIFFFSILQ